MSFFTKGDFKTREQWLKKQKKELMKKQSLKYHEHNKAGKPTANNANKISSAAEKKSTLANILKTDDTETNQSKALIEKQKIIFKNEKDSQLYHSMRERLIEQEQVAQNQRIQIKQNQRQIREMKTENSLLKASFHENAEEMLKKGKQMESESKRLKDIFHQMEKYLNDNGAYWQNNQIKGEIDIVKIKESIKQARTNYRTPTHFQFESLAKRIQELNQSLLDQFGSKKFTMVSGIHKLCQLQKVIVIFYKNGLRFESLNFCQYSSKDGIRILSDLADGYYPYILKDKYPEGVLIQIQNQLMIEYKSSTHENSVIKEDNNWFTGQCYSLEG